MSNSIGLEYAAANHISLGVSLNQMAVSIDNIYPGTARFFLGVRRGGQIKPKGAGYADCDSRISPKGLCFGYGLTL